MNMSTDFDRWRMTKAAMAIAGTLAIAGAVGSALAFSPIIEPPISWQGGAEFRSSANADVFLNIYVVPAGRNFLLTDLVASNEGSTSRFSLYSGAAGSCGVQGITQRVQNMLVPAENNTVLAFQTGIGFTAGQAVCILPSDEMNFNGRGFLFTPAPA